jgi:hypothetical protein
MQSPVLEYAPPPTHPSARRIVASVFVLVAVAALGAAAGESLARRGPYVSTAVIQCNPPPLHPEIKDSLETQDPQLLFARLADHVTAAAFLARLADQMNADAAPDRPKVTWTDLQGVLNVQRVRETRLIRLSATDADPDRAKSIAMRAGSLALEDLYRSTFPSVVGQPAPAYMWFALPDPGQIPPNRIRDYRLAGAALGATLAPLAAWAVHRRIRRHRGARDAATPFRRVTPP